LPGNRWERRDDPVDEEFLSRVKEVLKLILMVT
jgi:hypothetical protein